MLDAGILDKYVTIQSRSTSIDAIGGQSVTWADVKSIMVGIRPLYGRELVAAQAYSSEVSHLIRARYDPTLWANPKVAATYRIVYRGRYFNINAMRNVDEGDAEIAIYATEGLSDGG